MKTALMFFITLGAAAFLFGAIGKNYIDSAAAIGVLLGTVSFIIAGFIEHYRPRR